jgi:hypothetical protein
MIMENKILEDRFDKIDYIASQLGDDMHKLYDGFNYLSSNTIPSKEQAHILIGKEEANSIQSFYGNLYKYALIQLRDVYLTIRNNDEDLKFLSIADNVANDVVNKILFMTKHILNQISSTIEVADVVISLPQYKQSTFKDDMLKHDTTVSKIYDNIEEFSQLIGSIINAQPKDFVNMVNEIYREPYYKIKRLMSYPFNKDINVHISAYYITKNVPGVATPGFALNNLYIDSYAELTPINTSKFINPDLIFKPTIKSILNDPNPVIPTIDPTDTRCNTLNNNLINNPFNPGTSISPPWKKND